MKEFNISNRVATFTDGSEGIGFAMAMYLAEAGAHSAISGRHLDEG